MQEEFQDWIKESEENLSTAKLLYENEKYKDAAYYSHQVTEKALKAVQILKLKRFDMVHDLVQLAKSVKAPKEILKCSEDLTKYYISGKYPVENRTIPDEEEAQKALDQAEKVLEWAKLTLKL
ncbi:MAG: HEPN domain-containing protein [Candidatus Micrarchaeales archaeon]